MTLPLRSTAKNCCVEPVPRVAVKGESVIRMPESKVMLNVPVFFLSALDVAVMVTMTLGGLTGSGKTLGAVKVAVDGWVVPVAAMGVSVPTAGSPEGVLAVAQSAEVEGFGFGVAVVGSGVVVKEQAKVEVTSVAPETLALMVWVCVGTMTENWPLTVTTT